jgi:hypothetical protein
MTFHEQVYTDKQTPNKSFDSSSTQQIQQQFEIKSIYKLGADTILSIHLQILLRFQLISKGLGYKDPGSVPNRDTGTFS